MELFEILTFVAIFIVGSLIVYMILLAIKKLREASEEYDRRFRKAGRRKKK